MVSRSSKFHSWEPDASSRSWELGTKSVFPFSDIEHLFLLSEKEIDFLIFAVFLKKKTENMSFS